MILSGLSILGAAPVIFGLSGYWLAGKLNLAGTGQRLAASLVAGLMIILFTTSIVNLFVPLEITAAWICLSPALLTLGSSAARRSLRGDMRALLTDARSWILLAGAVGFLTLLLWPLLANRDAVYFDGTGNHDGFFWIVGGDHLQTHSYLKGPEVMDIHPATNLAGAITGWLPAWGRMGSEGLLAIASSITRHSTLEVYLYVSAALFLPWLAVIALVARTFLCSRLGWWATGVLALFQPIFAFYHHNANLPNLVGAVAGAMAIVASAHVIAALPTSRAARWTWAALLVLSLHGLMCAYPEMLPFVLLPMGLLALRTAWKERATSNAIRPVKLMLTLGALAVLIQPVTTVRAGYGFFNSFAMARANENWDNILGELSPSQFVPALLVLSSKTGRKLPPEMSLPITLALLGIALFVWWRARDRSNLPIIFSGALALALYTLITDFAYGWQKTVQFAGPCFAALLPLAAVQLLMSVSGRLRWSAYVTAAALVGFFGFTQAMIQLDLLKWSERKMLNTDWAMLQDVSSHQLPGKPVLIESASFEHSFFYSMWAAWFMRDSAVYYAQRGHEGGGYLRSMAAMENGGHSEDYQGTLVGRRWADSIDANSPHILIGSDYFLLDQANRILAMDGLAPVEGVPGSAGKKFSLTIVPHSDSVLRIELHAANEARGEWHVAHSLKSSEDFRFDADDSSWSLALPLVAREPQTLRFEYIPADGEMPPTEFAIARFVVRNAPPPRN